LTLPTLTLIYWPRGGSGQHPSMTTTYAFPLVTAFPMFVVPCPGNEPCAAAVSGRRGLLYDANTNRSSISRSPHLRWSTPVRDVLRDHGGEQLIRAL
jgi:hypothetical protein